MRIQFMMKTLMLLMKLSAIKLMMICRKKISGTINSFH
jgi:hypothetical protein